MAVMMVAGNQARMPKGLLQGIRTMTVNIVMEMATRRTCIVKRSLPPRVVLFVFILMIKRAVLGAQEEAGAMRSVRAILAKREALSRVFRAPPAVRRRVGVRRGGAGAC